MGHWRDRDHCLGTGHRCREVCVPSSLQYVFHQFFVDINSLPHFAVLGAPEVAGRPVEDVSPGVPQLDGGGAPLFAAYAAPQALVNLAETVVL